MTVTSTRLALLQQRRIRRAQTAQLVAKWTAAGVSLSVISDARHEEFIAKLRAAGSVRSRALGSFSGVLADFYEHSDLVLVIDWDVETEPGLLMRSDALAHHETFFRKVYPDGFVIADQPLMRALIVDFDKTDFEADSVLLANSD